VSCGPSERAGQAHRTDAGGSRHGRLPTQPGEVGGGAVSRKHDRGSFLFFMCERVMNWKIMMSISWCNNELWINRICVIVEIVVHDLWKFVHQTCDSIVEFVAVG
jgi:hypothetical protein